ncbi:MAG: hypothetical protein M3R07_10075 [Gemmatimonadota bacterium]|nr:hypothetical protein [Gemmatimonadota bacterium]
MAAAAGSAAGENSELALIPRAGHMPFWEAPADFFRIVEDFLNRFNGK